MTHDIPYNLRDEHLAVKKFGYNDDSTTTCTRILLYYFRLDGTLAPNKKSLGWLSLVKEKNKNNTKKTTTTEEEDEEEEEI